jgi:hypothetical protein
MLRWQWMADYRWIHVIFSLFLYFKLTVLECYRNFNCVAIQVSLEYQYTKCISRCTCSNWLPRHLLIYHSTRLQSYVIHGIGKIKLLCLYIIAKNEVILAAIQPMSSAKLKQQQQQQFNANLLRWGHNLKTIF